MVFLLIAGIVLFVGFIIWMVALHEKKRTAALAVVAQELGMSFSPVSDLELLDRMQTFALFNKGHSRRMKNVMTADAGNTTMSVFDYQYTTGGGQSSHVHSQTVVAMQCESFQLPVFGLRPEGVFHRIGAALGMQDIDFDHHPSFSNAFVLHGDDESVIREFFDQELLDFFTKHPGTYVECSQNTFIYMHGGRKKPEQLRSLIEEGYAIYSALEARTQR